MVWSEGGGEDDPIRQEVKAREGYTRKNNSKIKQEDMINTRRRQREGKAGDTQNIKNQNRNKNSINPKKIQDHEIYKPVGFISMTSVFITQINSHTWHWVLHRIVDP